MLHSRELPARGSCGGPSGFAPVYGRSDVFALQDLACSCKHQEQKVQSLVDSIYYVVYLILWNFFLGLAFMLPDPFIYNI